MPLLDESVAVIGVDAGVAWRAGELRATHYDRNHSALSLADCMLLASATPADKIATSDRAVGLTARKLGIDVIPLLDSEGNRPSLSHKAAGRPSARPGDRRAR